MKHLTYETQAKNFESSGDIDKAIVAYYKAANGKANVK
jgi:hypothetical protein